MILVLKFTFSKADARAVRPYRSGFHMEDSRERTRSGLTTSDLLAKAGRGDAETVAVFGDGTAGDVKTAVGEELRYLLVA